MRYVFLAVLLANLGFFTWQQLQPLPPERVSTGPGALPSGVSTIRLLAEKRGSTRERQLDQVVKSPRAQPVNDEGDCLAVGPFRDLFSGQDVVDQLAALDIATSLRALDRPTGESDYRVMIPPASSLENAFRKLRELKARDIDSYVITQGPDALAISLGVFSSSAGAEAARLARTREGYEVEISEIRRLHREYWIFSAESRNLEVPLALWEQIEEGHPGLEQRRINCAA